MPRISEFYGIVIAMYHREHGMPHFHASYGGYEAVISIGTLEVLAGMLPPRVMRLVRIWARAHTAELQANWERARRGASFEAIDPLP
ncbi:MAG TPA: DUF4160 domain-containing protein [Thermoleophilaceae bacterium]|jgi:hypothetical protein